jgi:uncharacterized protein (TIGR02284 family)
MKHEKIIDALNSILTRNYDAEKGYIESSRGSKNVAFREWMQEMADKRKEFGMSLKAEIMSLGGKPDTRSSILAGMHRYWIDFKTDYINDEVEAIIEEIQFGEERAIEDYNKVLKETSMLVTTRTLLTKQLNQIKDDLKSLKKLKNRLEQIHA